MTELSIYHSQTNKYKSDTLRISGIIEESIVDGPGVRLVVFTQGCKHNCRGCHNPQTHNFNGGYDIAIDDIIEMVKVNPLIDGITLSGGDPFEQSEVCKTLTLEIKKLGYSVVAYTGYTYEELINNKTHKELLENIDILIDGRFDISKKDLTLPFRGSANQRIINL